MKTILILLAFAALARSDVTFESIGRNLTIYKYADSELQRQGRIAYGQLAGTNQLPHQALIIVNGNLQSGGILISNLWALTSAGITSM